MTASRKWIDPFDDMSDAVFDARVGELFAARPNAVADFGIAVRPGRPGRNTRENDGR